MERFSKTNKNTYLKRYKIAVQGAVSFRGLIALAGIDGRMDSEYYSTVLENALLENVDNPFGENWIFQHDHA